MYRPNETKTTNDNVDINDDDGEFVSRLFVGNTGTLAVDGWAVTFGTARRGMGGLRHRPVPLSLYQM